MFHVKHLDGPIAAEHFGGDLEPDWRVERRPGGTYYFVVTDWTGATVTAGVRALLGDAVTECVRWSTEGARLGVSRETPPAR
jgi:hypothetical protein